MSSPRSRLFLFVIAGLTLVFWGAGDAAALSLKGCFASGPRVGGGTDGAADPQWNKDVDTITGALVGTGSWAAGDATS